MVKAADGMFAPKIEDGRMCRARNIDMKSFAAVAMNSMHYVLEHKPAVKFGVTFYLPTKNKAAKARTFYGGAIRS